jgi:hypothetical protein
MTIDMIYKGALAAIGCFAAAYVGQEVMGGELAGWVVGGVILAGTCGPLLAALLEMRRRGGR